jgi:hypothetical protein
MKKESYLPDVEIIELMLGDLDTLLNELNDLNFIIEMSDLIRPDDDNNQKSVIEYH